MAVLHFAVALGKSRDLAVSSSARVRVVHYSGAAHFSLHAHSTSSVTLILRGAVAEDSPTAPGFSARAGDCLVKPAGAPHENVFDEQGATTIQVELAEGAALDSEAAVRPSAYGLVTNPHVPQLLFELSELTIDGSADADIDGLICDLLGSITAGASRGKRQPGWLPRVEREIRQGIDGPLRVADLAESAGVHAVHLARCFQRARGCAVTEYVRRLRVQRAAELLNSSDSTACSAALRAGFFDQAHLSRCFRGVWGITPGAYRRIVRRACSIQER